MIDEDRQLLTDLRRMADLCGRFCAGVIENDLSRDDQLAVSAHVADMAHRIHTRALNTPIVIDSETV